MSNSDTIVDCIMRQMDKNPSYKTLNSFFKAKFRCAPSATSLQILTAMEEQLRPISEQFELLQAVSSNNVETAQNILSWGISANTTDIQDRSALHIAVERSYTNMVKLLLEHGADPNKQDPFQNTPLHLAACAHNFATVSLLLDAGADINARDKLKRLPLQLAVSKLQMLYKCWMEGQIRILDINAEILDVIITLLISSMKSTSTSADEREVMRLAKNGLEKMKLNVTSTCNDNMDDQMLQLLAGLQNFQIS